MGQNCRKRKKPGMVLIDKQTIFLTVKKGLSHNSDATAPFQFQMIRNVFLFTAPWTGSPGGGDSEDWRKIHGARFLP